MTLCFVSVDGAYAGVICAQDTPRLEAEPALRELRQLGVQLAMLTGDGRGVALAVGEEVGVAAEDVHASLLPQGKLEQVGWKEEAQGISLNAGISL